MSQFESQESQPSPSPNELERLQVLAVKHCPKDHHDWPEILSLTESLGKNPLLSSDTVSISRECAEYAALCMEKEDRSSLDFLNRVFPQGRVAWQKLIETKEHLTKELQQALGDKQ